MISLTMSSVLSKCRSGWPAAPVSVMPPGRRFVPKNFAIVFAYADVAHPCADGHSGCVGVTVDVGVLNRCDRSPEVEVVLRVPAPGKGVGRRDVRLRKEPCVIGDVERQVLILRQLPQILRDLHLRVDQTVKQSNLLLR